MRARLLCRTAFADPLRRWSFHQRCAACRQRVGVGMHILAWTTLVTLLKIIMKSTRNRNKPHGTRRPHTHTRARTHAHAHAHAHAHTHTHTHTPCRVNHAVLKGVRSDGVRASSCAGCSRAATSSCAAFEAAHARARRTTEAVVVPATQCQPTNERTHRTSKTNKHTTMNAAPPPT